MGIQCIGTRKDGSPCKGTPLAGRDVCFVHAPELIERRREGSAKGGANRSSRARARKQLTDSVMTISDIDGLLCKSLIQVSEGKLEPGPANAMAGLAKAITGIRQAGELERRLEELEQAAGIGTMRRIG